MSAIIERHVGCVNTACGSSDAMTIYEEETENGDVIYNAHCYSCEKNFTNNQLAETDWAEELGIQKLGKSRGVMRKEKKKNFITDEQLQFIKDTTVIDASRYRDIHKGVNERFQVKSEFNKDGKLLKRFYPIYVEDREEVAGYKVRVVETKDFYSIGFSGSDSELAGMRFMPKSGKYLLITGGEEDMMCAYNILATYQHKKGYSPIPVVSPSTSESASVKNIQKNYEWLDNFERIIICLDNDKVGREYAEKVAQVCPVGKAYIMDCPIKDACAAKEAGKDKEFIDAFYKATKYKPKGISSSSELGESVRQELNMVKVPLPNFMSKLQDMMSGGIPLGYIVNVGAASGGGKTSIINEMIYYWIFNSPYLVGIVSLELTKGQYGIAMLSRHLGKKLQLFSDPKDAIEFVNRPDNVQKEQELWTNEEGDPRWYLLDEREGAIENIKNQIKQLVVSCECRIIVLDPLQDILDSSTNEEQADFMRFQKQMVAKGVTFVNINHVRKAGSGEKAGSQGRDLVEEDFAGSSTIFKSGGINILAMRDKYHEDPVIRNTTRVILSKCRHTGASGPAGEWYYDNNTHTLHDKETFFKDNTIEASIPSDLGGVDPLEGDFVDFNIDNV